MDCVDEHSTHRLWGAFILGLGGGGCNMNQV